MVYWDDTRHDSSVRIVQCTVQFMCTVYSTVHDSSVRIVLGVANRVLGLQRHQARWSVESVHTKNIVSILHLLVALARHFRAPIRLPENVVVDVVIVTKREGVLTHRVIAEELTGNYDDVGMRCERDAFDTLFDHAPDKLMVVKKSLVTFVNKHLNKVGKLH